MGSKQTTPDPEQDAQILSFTKEELFINIPSINCRTCIYFENERIGETSDGSFSYKFPPLKSDEIKNSKKIKWELSFYFQNKSGHFNSNSRKQCIHLSRKNELYGLSLDNEQKVNEQIVKYQKLIASYEVKVKHPLNILLIGLTQSGKSSFINTINFCLKDVLDEIRYANTGVKKTGSKTFQKYQILPWLNFWDSPGWQGKYDDNEKDATLKEITCFWNKESVLKVCTRFVLEHDVVLDKLDVTNNLKIENQMHSVICLWNNDETGEHKDWAKKKIDETLRELLALPKPIQLCFALSCFDKYCNSRNCKMEAKNYSQSIYGEYIKMFMTRIETSSTKFGIYNYGKNNEEFENYMKLIVLFILDTSIRNALERTKN